MKLGGEWPKSRALHRRADVIVIRAPRLMGKRSLNHMINTALPAAARARG